MLIYLGDRSLASLKEFAKTSTPSTASPLYVPKVKPPSTEQKPNEPVQHPAAPVPPSQPSFLDRIPTNPADFAASFTSMEAILGTAFGIGLFLFGFVIGRMTAPVRIAKTKQI